MAFGGSFGAEKPLPSEARNAEEGCGTGVGGERCAHKRHFLISGQRDADSGWNASSPGIVAISL